MSTSMGAEGMGSSTSTTSAAAAGGAATKSSCIGNCISGDGIPNARLSLFPIEPFFRFVFGGICNNLKIIIQIYNIIILYILNIRKS